MRLLKNIVNSSALDAFTRAIILLSEGQISI